MARLDADFLVRPLDTVWFRGPRPFVAGEDSADPGLFPPTPWTFQGLVRTRLLLAALPGDLDRVDRRTIAELVGPPDRFPEGWRLEGPFPAGETAAGELGPWLPAPRFLLAAEGGGEPLQARPAPARPEGILSDLAPEQLLLGDPRRAKAPIGGWICAANLHWALTGEGSWNHQGHHPALPPFVAPEERPGVRIERDRATAVDHMLYVGTHHRFERGAGLLGRLRASTDPRIPADALSRGWGQAGRKGRLVEVRGPVTVDAPWSTLRGGAHLRLAPDRVPEPLRAWVVLLTPAFCRGDEPPFAVPRGAAQVRVVGHLASAGDDVGGFDRVAGDGRPLRAAWAAGGSWLVEITGGDGGDRLAAACALQGLSPHVPDALEAMGFGQRLVGLFDPETHLPTSGGSDADGDP